MNCKRFVHTGIGAELAFCSSLANADGGKLLLERELDNINAGSALAVALADATGAGANAISLTDTQTYSSSQFVGGTGVTAAGAGAGAAGNTASAAAGASVAPTPYGTSGNVSQTITSGGVTISSAVSNATGVYLP